ncbi:hypothetical protein GOODEAATRI_008180 [Goodea atripinnis]|uniref:Mediator of DNA damage checkpoint protein 1 n=1 Tax=Goodea atripinnis TaxID=208336 RepID=A0ABV0PLS2_9TELE
MDATQAIRDSISESEEEENEEENQNERGKPLAKLCILRNPDIPEKELPLFLGDNILGRDPNICTLQLLAPSVSKQHATVSISVYRRRGRDSEVDTEALVWDLGSMNGTRRGRLKLTPNVRYALSEGDGLILGNIPCRYVSSKVDSPSSLGDVGTSLGRHSEVNTRLSDSSDSKRDDVDTGGKECLKSSTKAMRTPVTGGCLSFEQTPIQPKKTLVPESDSDSESERGGRGDRKQKTIAPKTLPSTDETTKPSHVASGFQLEGMITDSDTDVDDDATVTSKAILFQGVHTADSAPPVQSGDFHLDSDTDLDEEEEGGTGAKPENPKIDEALDKSDKPTPTAPHNLHPDSDICDEVVSDPYVAEAGRADLDILSDSDTDLEEDSHPAIPAAAAAKNLSVFSAEASGALKPDYDADTDVDEPLVPQAGEEGNPGDLRMGSDTDVEDEEANLGEAGESQIPHLQRENTPGSLVPLLHNCSTPVQLSDAEACGFYAVAETQPFILQTRDCYKGLNPNQASVLESSAVEPEDQSMRGDSFQLEVSDSSHLQGELRALTMENTQAYVSVDVGANLEDAQAYTEKTSAENDSNLESTQPYGEDEEPSRCSEMSIKEGCVDLAFEATQAYFSEFYDEGSDEVERQDSARTESVASVCSSALAFAETQLMSSSVESNNPVCSLERVKTRVQNETEEHPEKHITEAQSVAPTQPMYTASDNEESDIEGLSAESLQPAKVETQPITPSALSLAETQPVHVSSDETQPMELCEDNESNAEDSEVLRPRKRKAKQLHIDNEESQQHTNSSNQSAETQPVNSSEGDDDSDSMPSLRKKKAKPLQLEDETQSLAGSQVSAAESQPSATHEEEQSSKDFISAEKRKANPLDIEDEQIISEAAAGLTSEDGETQPMAACKNEGLPERETKALPLPAAGVSAVEAEAEGRDRKNDNESMTCARKRKSKRLHLEEEETQPITVSEVSASRRKTAETKVLPSAKERREQTKCENDSNQDKVLFTGVVDESGEQVLARLGGAMAKGVSDMNCLVTDKVRRTVKFLCAVAKGVPVSGKAGSFLSPYAFVVKDPEQEKKFSFSLQESLRTASSQPLLQPRTVVISCEEDLRLCGPAMSASLLIVTAEFILTGILQQRVDFQTHALPPPVTNLQPAAGRERGRKKT